jgi:hypothetical protein
VTSPDLSVRDLRAWASVQAERLRRELPEDAASHPAFVLAQAAKLEARHGSVLYQDRRREPKP